VNTGLGIFSVANISLAFVPCGLVTFGLLSLHIDEVTIMIVIYTENG